MLGSNVRRRIVGADHHVVIEDVELESEDSEAAAVVHVRLRKGARRRCGRCAVRAPGYDQGEGRRKWCCLDLGTLQCFLEADTPKVSWPEHGPTVALVPWARHGAGHTRDFDDQVAWLVTHTAKSTVCELLRVGWRTVGSIIERVVADGRVGHGPFAGLVRIGIDEISYTKVEFRSVHSAKQRSGSQAASSAMISDASSVVVRPPLRCRRTPTGTPMGISPQGGATLKVTTTRLSPVA